ncbi:SDR family oxidoreductase [Spirosoma harenae]
MSDKTVSIIGLGWLGLPLAERLQAENVAVKGSTTSSDKAATLSKTGIEVYQLELKPEPVGDLAPLLLADTLVVNVPPKAGKLGDDFHPKQISHLADTIRSSSVKHIIYVSSTSIYPDLNREMVEGDVVDPEQSASPAFVHAEQTIQSLTSMPNRPVITILRCGGLLGYERIPGKYVAGRTIDTGSLPVNYIHRDDAVGILAELITKRVGGTFNAIIPLHPTRESVYRKNCADFGFPLPTFVEPAEPIPYKIISPEKLIRAIKYTFRYPDPLEFYYQL